MGGWLFSLKLTVEKGHTLEESTDLRKELKSVRKPSGVIEAIVNWCTLVGG